MAETQVKATEQIQPIRITAKQLPLCCPPPDSELWNMHPRVYIDIKPGETKSCPYCGASYYLAEN